MIIILESCLDLKSADCHPFLRHPLIEKPTRTATSPEKMERRVLHDVVTSDDEVIIDRISRNINNQGQNATYVPVENVSYPRPRGPIIQGTRPRESSLHGVNYPMRPIEKKRKEPTARKSTTFFNTRPILGNFVSQPRVCAPRVEMNFVDRDNQIVDIQNLTENAGSGSTRSINDEKTLVRDRLEAQIEKMKNLAGGYRNTILRLESLLEENKLRFNELNGDLKTTERLFRRLMAFENQENSREKTRENTQRREDYLDPNGRYGTMPEAGACDEAQAQDPLLLQRDFDHRRRQ